MTSSPEEVRRCREALAVEIMGYQHVGGPNAPDGFDPDTGDCAEVRDYNSKPVTGSNIRRTMRRPAYKYCRTATFLQIGAAGVSPSAYDVEDEDERVIVLDLHEELEAVLADDEDDDPTAVTVGVGLGVGALGYGAARLAGASHREALVVGGVSGFLGLLFGPR